MARKAFAFALGQRVNVPGKKNVQGVVSLPIDPGEIHMMAAPTRDPLETGPFYPVAWTDDSGRRTFAWFTQQALDAANAPPAEVIGVDGAGAGDTFHTTAVIMERVNKQWRPSRKPILKRSDLRKPARRRKTKR